MCTVLRRSTVESWNVEPVRAWARQLAESRTDVMDEADTTRNHFQAAASVWQGRAYDAAYDRVAQDHDQVRKLAMEIDELVGVVEAVVNDVEYHRQSLLGRVADAQALGMVIDDVWKVMDYDTAEPGVRQAHQELIDGARWPFEDAVSKAAQRIAEQAVEIRSAGDLLGSSLDVADADTQAARFGRGDGAELADAVRRNDEAAIDRITAQLPQPVLSQFEIDQLARGEEVTTLPASTQDYYRAFFDSAGKDGILGLNEQLQNREKAGDPIAAVQRDNLANSVLAVSNENVKSSNGSPGSYDDLPPDLQTLISGHPTEYVGDTPMSGPELADHYAEVGEFADLLDQSSPGMQPGHQLGVELGRQSEEIIDFLNNSDGKLPPGFDEGTDEDMRESAQQLLGVATRNDDVSYSLLTGNDMPERPDLGPDYKPGKFDADDFRDTIFREEWPDDGKSAAGLLDWIAEDSNKPGEEGDRARQTLTDLPDYFAPMSGPSDLSVSGRPEMQSEDGQTSYEKNVRAFAENPALADSLANVMGSNIDAYISPNVVDSGVRGDQAALSQTDADRLLFLSSQSEGGRLMLEVSRQAYESDMISRALTEGNGDPQRWLDIYGSNLADLNARHTSAITNALTFQDQEKINEHNDAAQETYDNRQKAGDIAKSALLDTLDPGGKGPAGVVAGPVYEVLKEQGYEGVMDKWNPEPDPVSAQYPDASRLDAETNDRMRQSVLTQLFEQGELADHGYDLDGRRVDLIGPDGRLIETETSASRDQALNEVFAQAGLIGFVNDYSRDYSLELRNGIATRPDDLEILLTGKSAQ
ncbi:TPR repeat region-containing protein [Nocardia harenae]|uniref:TPR repeat region-containing protein n=1 Tax=Nocardia harenae TaxID=358707 RepID=UPI000AD4DAFE|nr:hypothetical protein [Nocardia harenae]